LSSSLKPASAWIAIGLVLAAFALQSARSAAPLQPALNVCAEPSAPVATGTAQWNGWGRDLENTRYQPEPALRAADAAKLRLKWSYGYDGARDNGQPSVVDGRVFVASASGRVFALDARTGCTYWTYDAAAGSNSAIVVGELEAPKRLFGLKKLKITKNAHIEIEKGPSAVFFGDDAGAIYALDARTGHLLWRTQADPHPLARISGSPALYRDRLYVPVASSEQSALANPAYACCSFRGSVVALDIANGRVVWKTYLSSDEAQPTGKTAAGTPPLGPSGMAIESAPTIDVRRGVLYVATGDAYGGLDEPAADAVVALGLADGKTRWVKKLVAKAGSAAFMTSPILRTLSLTRQILVAAQRTGIVYGLDPDREGELVWQSHAEAGEAAVQWGPAADHRSVYAAFAALPAAGGAAPQSEAAGPSGPDAAAITAPNAAPVAGANAPAAPVAATAGLVALDVATGKLRWATPAPLPPCSWGPKDCSHAESQAVTVIPGVAFSGATDGHLRAYSSIDGHIAWDFDTARDFATVNGIPAAGGALDHGGPTIVGGTLYVNSGDALLAFSVDGK
jgi:polyvinyl alcohol dehydrogenase (cytochrome)